MTHPARRIVSLVPSQTELLHFLGLEDQTVGITKFCVHPKEWSLNKRRVGGTKSIDVQLIIDLNPDLIIANKEENVQSDVEVLSQHFPVWLTDVNTLEEANRMIQDIGKLTGKPTEAIRLATQIQGEFSQLGPYPPVRSCYLIWKDPYMAVAADTFINDMMQKAGFENVFSNKSRYPEVSLQEIEHAQPKVILLSTEPYPFSQKHVNELQGRLPGINIILVDGELFSWYGSRLLQAPAYFKKIFGDALESLGTFRKK